MGRKLAIILLLFMVLSRQESSAQSYQPFSYPLAFSPDGTRLAFIDIDTLQIISTVDGTVISERQLADIGTDVAFSPTGQYLAIGLNNAHVMIFESNSLQVIAEWQANLFWVSTLLFSPNGDELATGGGLGPTRVNGQYDVAIWDTQTWQEITPFRMSGRGTMTAISYSPDGRYLAFGSFHRGVVIVDLEEEKVVSVIHHEIVDAIIFSEDATQLVIGYQGQVERWVIRLEPEFHLTKSIDTRDWQGENEASLATNARVFLTGIPDGTIQLRSLENGTTLSSYAVVPFSRIRVELSQDRGQLALVARTPDEETYFYLFHIDENSQLILTATTSLNEGQ